MKKWIYQICLVLAPSALAQDTVPLIEIYRSVPDVQERFSLSSHNGVEEMFLGSNFLVQRQEFGKYARPASDLAQQVEKIKNSVNGTDWKEPAHRTIHLEGWHVFLSGKELDPTDPRFGQAFDLMKTQASSGNWSRRDVTLVKFALPNLEVMEVKYPAKKTNLSRPSVVKTNVPAFQVCRDVDGRMACKIDGQGYVYLQQPKGAVPLNRPKQNSASGAISE